MGRRRRRRRRGFFRRLGRAISRVGRAVGRVVRGVVKTAAKIVTAPLTAAASVANKVLGRRRGGGSSSTDRRPWGFGKVSGNETINITVNPSPAEMGDKIDIDWDEKAVKNKMVRIHIHRIPGFPAEIKQKVK
tara:strand:+ start:260 stop:658 length:399 start_codon:yes stop_codon:yes gene_type:complete